MPELLNDLMVDITQTIEINAAPGDAFKTVIRRLTSANVTPDGKEMPMVLEEWPGGRWFRDLGTGQGHLWGFVQVIKPPTLLEIHGPMWMSYAVASHIQMRLTPIAGGVELYLRHHMLGLIDEQTRSGATLGWDFYLQDIKRQAEA